MDSVTIIIRSSGERTNIVCKNLIIEQGIPESKIIVVKEIPFSAAMKKSFEIGVKKAEKWTFCIDADVLIRPGAIKKMLEEAEKLDENVCEVQGLILDKFFGGPRPGGIHLYRTKFLSDIISRIPEEGINIRPEHYVLEQMAVMGIPWIQISYIVGIHDDEQYYRDVYRKCFVHGVKHQYIAPLFISLWKRKILDDPDFRIALQAFTDSIHYDDQVYIDIQQPIYKKQFQKLGLLEKPELDETKISGILIEERIKGWEIEPEYLRFMPKLTFTNSKNGPQRKVKWYSRLCNIWKKRGLIKGGVLILAKFFLKCGYALLDLSQNKKIIK